MQVGSRVVTSATTRKIGQGDCKAPADTLQWLLRTPHKTNMQAGWGAASVRTPAYGGAAGASSVKDSQDQQQTEGEKQTED